MASFKVTNRSQLFTSASPAKGRSASRNSPENRSHAPRSSGPVLVAPDEGRYNFDIAISAEQAHSAGNRRVLAHAAFDNVISEHDGEVFVCAQNRIEGRNLLRASSNQYPLYQIKVSADLRAGSLKKQRAMEVSPPPVTRYTG